VVEKIKYDPYGEATVTVQDGQSASGNPYLFQGRRWDDEVGLHYFRNRVYSPILGFTRQFWGASCSGIRLRMRIFTLFLLPTLAASRTHLD